MNKQEHDEAVASLREICKDIGCTQMGEWCKIKPQNCGIIRKVVMPSTVAQADGSKGSAKIDINPYQSHKRYRSGITRRR